MWILGYNRLNLFRKKSWISHWPWKWCDSLREWYISFKKGYLQVALLLGKLLCHKLDIHLIPFQRSLQKQHKSHPLLRPFLRTQTCFEDKNRRCCSSKHLFETAFYYSDFKQKAEVIHNCIATRQTNKQGKPCVNSHCVVSIWYAVGRKCPRKKYGLPSKQTILTSYIVLLSHQSNSIAVLANHTGLDNAYQLGLQKDLVGS